MGGNIGVDSVEMKAAKKAMELNIGVESVELKAAKKAMELKALHGLEDGLSLSLDL